MDDLKPVTQADRDAADSWWDAYNDAQGTSASPASLKIAFHQHAVRAARRALEAAAKACEAELQAFSSEQYAVGQPLGAFGERFACKECATAIRALDPSSILEGSNDG